MSRAVSQEDILDASLRGVRNAFTNYRKWSGGYWLGHAPESLMQVEVARSLSKICPFVTLEDTVRSILLNADAERRGRNPRGNASGRVDIIVWWSEETPRVLIEVKKGWGNNIINNDAKRIRQLLNRGGSQQTGLIVVYTDAKKAQTVDSRFETIATNSDTTIRCRLGPIKKVEEGEVWYWDSACFSVNL